MRTPKMNSKTDPTGAATPIKAGAHFPMWLVAALLVLLTIAAYWPALQCNFINYDDWLYVTSNVHARTGLTW